MRTVKGVKLRDSTPEALLMRAPPMTYYSQWVGPDTAAHRDAVTDRDEHDRRRRGHDL